MDYCSFADLIKKIFSPRGYKLNGTVEWQGEDRDDMGMIEIKDNKVKTKYAMVTYVTDEENN